MTSVHAPGPLIEQALDFINTACRNWDMPTLTEDDIDEFGHELERFKQEAVFDVIHGLPARPTTDEAIAMIPDTLRLCCLVELDDGRWAAKLALRGEPGGLPSHCGETPAKAIEAAVGAIYDDLAVD